MAISMAPVRLPLLLVSLVLASCTPPPAVAPDLSSVAPTGETSIVPAAPREAGALRYGAVLDGWRSQFPLGWRLRTTGSDGHSPVQVILTNLGGRVERLLGRNGNVLYGMLPPHSVALVLTGPLRDPAPPGAEPPLALSLLEPRRITHGHLDAVRIFGGESSYRMMVWWGDEASASDLQGLHDAVESLRFGSSAT